MRYLLLLGWLLLGIVLFFSGCQASLTADGLEAAITVDNPSVPTVTVVNELPEGFVESNPGPTNEDKTPTQ